MGFLKRHGIGLLAVLCCGALGLLLARQNTRLQTLRQENAALTTRLDAVEAAAAERSEETEAYAEILSSSVDGEAHTLTIVVSAVLPGSEETYVEIGLCQPGEPYRMAWNREYLRQQADGTYAVTLTFPLDLEMGLELRLEDDTVLFSTAYITDLLPLQFYRRSPSFHFNSEVQTFSVCDFDANLTDLSGQEAHGRDGTFQIYRNGELVFVGNEIADSYNVEADGQIYQSVGVDCTEGDRVRVSYACTDEAGLRYEAVLMELLTRKWDGLDLYPVSGRPTVTWAE